MVHTYTEPASVKQALTSPTWSQDMKAELDALQANKTWTLTSLTSDRKEVGCRWVFKVKYNSDGSLLKHKARMVAKGFHQEQGFDYTETFSLVVKPITIRVIFNSSHYI